MKILHCVESYFPSLGGMQEVVKQLSEKLVLLGHDVTVATKKQSDRAFVEKNGVKIVDFNVSGNIVAGIQGEKEKYELFLLNSNFDIVVFFAAQQWATDIALPILDKIKGKKISVPTGYSGLYWPDYNNYFDNMKKWIHGYDMNVYLSNNYRDINFARSCGVSKLILIPNGAGADEFLPDSKINVRQQLNISKNDFLILHVGSYTYWKGHHAAIEIALKSKIKNLTLLMIGNNYENFKINFRNHSRLLIAKLKNKLFGRKRIIFKYFPRDFTVAAYKQADLFLFPSNIECSPIVLFECAAAGLPFLATDVGNSTEIAQWTKGGQILPTLKDENGFSHAKINESVIMLNDLYGNEVMRKQMSHDSFNAWKEKYTWEAITKQYEKLYNDLLK